jgi:hypothetical protein
MLRSRFLLIGGMGRGTLAAVEGAGEEERGEADDRRGEAGWADARRGEDGAELWREEGDWSRDPRS